MRVIQHNGMWAVTAPDGTIIKDGLSNAEAWRWMDRNTYEGLDDTDRAARIRDAFAGDPHG